MVSKKNLVVYIGYYGIVLVLGMLFQTTLAYNIAIGGIHPNIMMPFTVMAALYGGRRTGAFLGLAVGILWDVLGASVMGFYGLLFLILGFLVGIGGELVLQRSFFSAIILSGAGVLLQGFCTYSGYFLLEGKGKSLFAFVHIIVPEFIYSLVLSVPLYFLVKHIIKAIGNTDGDL